MPQIYKNSEGFPYKYPENHPIVSLIYLLGILVSSYVVFSFLGMFIGLAMYGSSFGESIKAIVNGGIPSDTGFLKVFLAISSIGTFIVPAFLLKLIERKKTSYLNFSSPQPAQLFLITIAIMFVSSPFLELTSIINKQMLLPDFLSKMEQWMQMKEQEMARITESVLSVSSLSGLLANLFIMAVIPGIGEELFFRGCLQPIIHRWTKNAHWAIWITAIIFSAIHVQFYGFIPRLLMGAVFGYMLYWGKSIWLPIIAHFINNATAVIYTFVLLKQGKSFEEINNGTTSNWVLYLLSIGLLTILLYRFWSLNKVSEATMKNNTQNLT